MPIITATSLSPTILSEAAIFGFMDYPQYLFAPIIPLIAL
jgi:hypothetical protein